MDEEATLRLEQVKLAFQTVERVIDLRARRHLAILAFALASLVSASVAGFARQVPIELVVGLDVVLVAVSIRQLLALERLERELREAGRESNDALERLMSQGGERDADAAEVHRR